MIFMNLEKEKQILSLESVTREIENLGHLTLDLNNWECPLSELSRILGLDFPDLESYYTLSSLLGMNKSEIWKTIPDHVKNNYLNEISVLISNLDLTSFNYLYTLSDIKDFLRSLSIPKFNRSELINILESCNSLQRAKEIRENPDIISQKIVYSNSKTSTGRLTVVGGLNVLTLPADFKKSIRSSFKGGSIVQIDIISAEPKIAWKLAGLPDTIDVYEKIAEFSEFQGMTREIAKQATICALYGQSSRNLAQILPLEINSRKLIERVKNILGFEKLALREVEDGHYRNILGRPLKVDSGTNPTIRVSHFLQSSAADLSLLLFADFCKRVEDRAVPLFSIHDALVVDCDAELSDYLRQKNILRLKYGSYDMHAKATFVGN